MALTVAKDFNSQVQKIANERDERAKKNREVSKYEGVVPVHQRLILLVQDFLESVDDFELNDLFNLQNLLKDHDQMVDKEKADKLVRLSKELFKKY